MHSFPGGIFLDPPKTGTTFISKVIDKTEPNARLVKHKPIPRTLARDKPFIFSAIRNPFDWYRSSYAYGVRRDGGGRKALYAFYGEERIAALFDFSNKNFNEWANLHMNLQEMGYLPFMSTPGWQMVGRYTHRFMKLALPNAGRIRPSHDEVLRVYAGAYPRAYVRTEHLRADLAAIIEGPLWDRLTAPDEALRMCKSTPVANKSPKPALSFDKATKQRVLSREHAMFELWNSLIPDPDTGIVTSNLQRAKP